VSTGSHVGTRGVPRAERERQIIDAAISEFATHGYAGASVGAIADAVGISKTLIFQYFGSKDGLHAACLRQAGDALLTRVHQAMATDDASLRLPLQVLQGMFEALAPHPAVWLVLYDQSIPPASDAHQTACDYRERIAATATLGTERFLTVQGRLDRGDASALRQVWMSVVNALITWWIHHPDQSAADMTARCHRILGALLTQATPKGF
jgi:AcrR family transcriptional regulator